MESESAYLDEITLQEMRELWPKSDDGRLCARLLQRYAFSLLVNSAAGAECTESRAQAECGADRAIARMVKDFGVLPKTPAQAPVRSTMPPLNRFKTSDPKENEDRK